MKGKEKKTKKQNKNDFENPPAAYLSSVWLAEADDFLPDTEITFEEHREGEDKTEKIIRFKHGRMVSRWPTDEKILPELFFGKDGEENF